MADWRTEKASSSASSSASSLLQLSSDDDKTDTVSPFSVNNPDYTKNVRELYYSPGRMRNPERLEGYF